MASRQRLRLLFRTGFFLLFVLAPPLDIFRLDLTLGHFIFFGHNWTLGLEPVMVGEAATGSGVVNVIVRVFVPIVAVIALVAWVSWKYGRLYCGWLCPHFSVVESINRLMQRASGKPSLWEPGPLPTVRADGKRQPVNPHYWLLVWLAVLTFAFLWALTLLTYLLPPKLIYHNVLHGELTRNQGLFLGVATGLLMVEFLAARHLFCRFGCAVGLAQSFIWMGNKKAMVIDMDRQRSSACASCGGACDNACPMRLKPRATKRWKFACTQCGQCLTACEQSQWQNPEGALLHWVAGERALNTSDRDFGRAKQRQQQLHKQCSLDG
jgi:ferredoxin-type protein NapH